MDISVTESRMPTVLDVDVSDHTLRVTLSDGRALAVPSGWYPRLAHAKAGELGNHRRRRGHSLAATRRGHKPVRPSGRHSFSGESAVAETLAAHEDGRGTHLGSPTTL